MEKSSSLAKSKHLSQVDSLIIFCPTDLEKNEFSPRAAPVSARKVNSLTPLSCYIFNAQTGLCFVCARERAS
jgi:hypothetical protein